MEAEKIFEYTIAGCISAALVIIVLIALSSMFVESTVNNATELAITSLEEKISNIDVNCSSVPVPKSIEIHLNGENFYCAIK